MQHLKRLGFLPGFTRPIDQCAGNAVFLKEILIRNDAVDPLAASKCFRLLSEAEDLSSFDIEYQLWEDEGTGLEACTLKEGRFELINGRYHLFYEGEEYVWQNVA